MTEHKIDATNRSLGRVASEAATLLRGKDSANFERHVEPKSKVSIFNASKVNISEKKLGQKEYTHYTGYPGGLRKIGMGRLLEQKGCDELLRKAVKGMLPANKLRPKMLKNLVIID